jgi:hypothetical protein
MRTKMKEVILLNPVRPVGPGKATAVVTFNRQSRTIGLHVDGKETEAKLPYDGTIVLPSGQATIIVMWGAEVTVPLNYRDMQTAFDSVRTLGL